ncbi:MAG: hypothetical protein KC502_00810 [Myxococcales bacterium]|nr:hypothetical protein [Myxococcales bacterium]
MTELQMAQVIVQANARLRMLKQRLTLLELDGELRCVAGLQEAIADHPEAWRRVSEELGASAQWWLYQVALAVTAGGLPAQGQALLTALPLLPATDRAWTVALQEVA